MKNLFIINEEEKNRILNLHETATKNHYLTEQNNFFNDQLNTQRKQNQVVVQGQGNDPYQYMKWSDKLWYAKKIEGNTPKWKEAKTRKSIDAIKTKIYGIQPTVTPNTKKINKTTSNNFKLEPELNTVDIDNTRVGNGRDKRILKPGKSVVKKPAEEKSLFDRITSSIKQFVTNAVSFVVPIHYRIFYDFLSLRKKPFTLTDMSNEEQQALKQMIQYGFKNGFKNGGSMNFYDIANKLNAGSEQINFKNKENLGLNQFNLKSEYTKLSMTLGDATVTKSGGKYIVTDIYDFNNYQNNPEKYTLKEVPSTVKDSIKKVASGNLVQGVEQMASYYQKLGYKGIPVDIQLPA
jgi:hypothetical protein